ncbi:hypothetical protein [Acidovorax sp. LjRoot117]|uniref:hypothetical protein n=1 Tax=Acidovorax sp. LjRoot117 TaxID=3342255 RepID=UPI003ECF0EB8
MEIFEFFVSNFVQSQYRDRWFYLRARGWDKVRKNLNQLENQLDQKKTVLVQKNAMEFAAQKISELKLLSGVFIDFREGEVPLKGDILDGISGNSVLVFEREKVAFYFHDEGWVYFCQ